MWELKDWPKQKQGRVVVTAWEAGKERMISVDKE